jgi:hypothetical protein
MPRTIYTVAVAYRLSDRVRPVGPTTEEPTLIRGEFESWRAARPYAYIVPWPDDDRWPQARTCERKRRRNEQAKPTPRLCISCEILDAVPGSQRCATCTA